MNKASTLLLNTGAVFPIQSLSVRHRCSHGGATRGPRVLTEMLSVVTESASPAHWEMVRVLQEDPIGGNWVKGTQDAFLKNFLLNVNLQLRYNMKFNLQMCVRIKFF